ncbi:vWA domain-containing protein [Maribacter sp. 2304DJ31-5]|uniref:vWA domain-containing protein n=1 Tax=Maribacter sp. 2304DJ31-5 TaxID=3386273 RepID=UPI0039BD0450
MGIKTISLIILAAVIALFIVLLQYHFKVQNRSRQNLILSFLRFLGIFGVLLLIVNPKFKKTIYTIEKTNLAVLVDNSSSMGENGERVQEVLSTLTANGEIKNRFNIDTYRFGDELVPLDSLSFTEKQTNIDKSIRILENIYSKENTAVILLSDGNQTIGRDYSFTVPRNNLTVYPITVGDTTVYEDLNIGPVNTNTYAFLRNKFPLETFVTYQGNGSVSANVSIHVNGKSVYTRSIKLSEAHNLQNIHTTIEANSVGFKNIEVTVTELPTEKNTFNNARKTVVEVIDEKTKIGLISTMVHPDLGALKKSIESNEQRVVKILKPNAGRRELEDIDLFIIYQPIVSFKNIFDYLKKARSDYFLITGINTDFGFLNSVQSDFNIEDGYPQQEVIGSLYNGFTKFDISDFDLIDFPPLASNAGPITFNLKNDPLLGTEIKGLDINTPLLTIFADDAVRKALLLGEDIWKWRIQSYRNNGDFSNFDAWMGKLVRYLGSSKSKNRLKVNYSRNYAGSNEAIITATYFDETYIFDPNARISISVKENDEGKTINLPMVLKNGFFEVDLTHLLPGNYSFTVAIENKDHSESGRFTISDFDMEQQFVSSDFERMEQLAGNTSGKHYFMPQFKNLLDELVSNNAYIPTQKGTENIVSLIDFKILLAIIAIAFAMEWFIRKYNGLI